MQKSYVFDDRNNVKYIPKENICIVYQSYKVMGSNFIAVSSQDMVCVKSIISQLLGPALVLLGGQFLKYFCVLEKYIHFLLSIEQYIGLLNQAINSVQIFYIFTNI